MPLEYCKCGKVWYRRSSTGAYYEPGEMQPRNRCKCGRGFDPDTMTYELHIPGMGDAAQVAAETMDTRQRSFTPRAEDVERRRKRREAVLNGLPVDDVDEPLEGSEM